MLFEQTELGRLETYANASSNGAIKYLFASINAAIMQKALNSKKADKDSFNVGIKYCCKTPMGDFEPVAKNLTYKEFKGLYTNCAEFNTMFPSFEVFAQTLYKLATDNTRTRTDIRVARSDNDSIANQVVSRGQDSDELLTQIPKFITIPLNTNFSAVCYQPSEEDKWYLEHMCRDENGQLYWRFKTPVEDCGCVYPLSIRSDKGGKAIDDDPKFWEHFFEEEGETLRRYCTTVDAYIKNFYAGVTNPDYYQSDLPAFEAGLRSICPTVLINSYNIGFITKTVNNKPVVIDISLRLKTGAGFDRNQYQDILSQTFLKSIPISKLKVIKVFDDVASNAVHKLPTRPFINQIPTEHPRLLDYDCPNWDNFLHSEGPDGQTKFPSQRMGELRLAKAVVSMCEKSDFSRQILSIAGEGDDGKSVFIDALRGILGDNLVSPGKSQNDLASSFGMQDMINRRVIIFDDIADPYKFFNNEIIKQLSGAGDSPIEVQRKFLSAWAWRPSGCKIVMSANKPYSLYDEATITRCMPLTFLKNYTLRNAIDCVDLKNSLISEGTNLIKWCYAVCLYYNSVRNCNDEICPLFRGAHNIGRKDDIYSFVGKNLIICSDEQFDAWMKGQFDLAPDNVSQFRAQRNEAYSAESQIPHKATPFITLKQEDSEEAEINDYFASLCDCLFTKSEDTILRSSDFGLQMLDFICMREADAQANDTTLKIFRLLRASGLSSLKTLKDLTSARLWSNFKQFICDKYGVEFKTFKVQGKAVKGIKGLSMITYEAASNNGDNVPSSPSSENDNIFDV